MKRLEEVLKMSDLEYFGTAKHKLNMEKTMELYQKDKAIVLDVRSKEEQLYLSFAFAKQIPLHELPDRVSELPKDKVIVAFCTTANRSAMAFTYLRALGYEVKILAESISDMAGFFKPDYALKQRG